MSDKHRKKKQIYKLGPTLMTEGVTLEAKIKNRIRNTTTPEFCQIIQEYGSLYVVINNDIHNSVE